MTEPEAREWIAARFGGSAVDRLTSFVGMVIDENGSQNLIAPSTVEHIWVRHILDSAQLIDLAPPEGRWLDVGTGGGFPGMVVAMLRDSPVLLVEPRRRRATFLMDCITRLDLGRQVGVAATKVEQVTTVATIISARAVATIENLLLAAASCTTTNTCWLLPRGLVTAADRLWLERHWRGAFHVKHSITDARSEIVVLEHGRLA